MSTNRIVMRGAAWNGVWLIITKVITFACQIALTWVLSPGEVGVASLGLSITSIASALSGSVLGDFLIAKKDAFHRTAGPLLIGGLVLNVSWALLIIILAPSIAAYYQQPDLLNFLYILAIAFPFSSLHVIWTVSLKMELKLFSYSAIAAICAIFQALSALELAICGFGSLSLALPVLPTVLLLFLLSRLTAGHIPFSLGISKASLKEAWNAGVCWMYFQNFLANFAAQGAILTLGFIVSKDQLGIFAFSLMMSSQLLYFVTTITRNVFYPVFVNLNSTRSEQEQLFYTSVKAYMNIYAYACIFQIPFFFILSRGILGKQWEHSAYEMMVLSLATLMQPIAIVLSSLMNARSSFKKVAGISIMQTLLTLIGVSFTLVNPTALNAALGLLGSNLIASIIILIICGRITERSMSSLMHSWVVLPMAGAVALVIPQFLLIAFNYITVTSIILASMVSAGLFIYANRRQVWPLIRRKMGLS